MRAHGARLVGPNCLGIAVPALGLNATFAPRALPPGRIAFSSQSGALGLALLEKASERGLGFSAFVSIGNKADVSSNDLLEWWEEDEDTDVVLLYLESFGNPQKFARVAGRVARRKPILALKAGTSSAGARAASSHTAALAGSDAAVEALFRSAGVLRARNLEELVDVATLLSSQPLPKGRRVAVLTNAGGLGILCADACDAAGLELPELAAETRQALGAVLPSEASVANPVDLLGSATGATYAQALPHVLRDPGIDAVIVLFVPPVVAGADEVAAAIREALEREPSEKPVLAVVVSADGTPETLTRSGLARRDVRVSGVRRARARDRGRPRRVAAAPGGHRSRARRRRPRGRAAARRRSARGVRRRLARSGGDPRAARRPTACRSCPSRSSRTPTRPSRPRARSAARSSLKTAAAGVHKTESGGVALEPRDRRRTIRAAAERIGGPLLVQPMIRGGTELLAGIVQDPVFGPLVAFGPGGVLAELIGGARVPDRAAHRPRRRRARAGRQGGPARARLPRRAGRRREPRSSTLVHRLSLLAVDLPEVAELDLNPVLALPDGCVAVDARIRLRARPESRSLKSW